MGFAVMIIVTARNFDMTYSPIILRPDPSSDAQTVRRRVSREGTLDGAGTLVDLGFSDSDRLLIFTVLTPTENDVNGISGLCQTHANCRVSTREGVFLGTIEQSSFIRGSLNFRFLAIEKESR